MSRVEKIIDDYVRRIEIAESNIEKVDYLMTVSSVKKAEEYFLQRHELVVRLSCYKGFVAELQRLVL